MALCNLANFSGSCLRSVQLVLHAHASIEGRGLAGQLESLVKIWEVELEDEDSVSKVVALAEFFELFG